MGISLRDCCELSGKLRRRYRTKSHTSCHDEIADGGEDQDEGGGEDQAEAEAGGHRNQYLGLAGGFEQDGEHASDCCE